MTYPTRNKKIKTDMIHKWDLNPLTFAETFAHDNPLSFFFSFPLARSPFSIKELDASRRKPHVLSSLLFLEIDDRLEVKT